MNSQSPNTDDLLEALRRAVSIELERKRRLGHYAVFWKNGEILIEGEDAPVMYGSPKESPARDHWIEDDDT